VLRVCVHSTISKSIIRERITSKRITSKRITSKRITSKHIPGLRTDSAESVCSALMQCIFGEVADGPLDVYGFVSVLYIKNIIRELFESCFVEYDIFFCSI